MGTKLNLNEINKHLDKKDLDADLSKSLKDKKKILENNKTIKK